jgi:hypothetical protein
MSEPTADTVRVWEDDPGAPPSPRSPVRRPRPSLLQPPLAVDIATEEPPASQVGDRLRYWTAAEALHRTASLYAPLFGSAGSASWNPAVGPTLIADLDAGEDLNAYYDREGLKFFRQEVGGVTVWSGESPDIVSHETGHAVLDALCPWMWDAASAEIAAFHESFGDMSALLSGLQIESLAERVIGETDGELSRTSRLSRLAEQLGWAIRQIAPSSADPDCLRNASNTFFYQDPVTLPPSSPASSLSSEPHSFSRVFTGSFLRVLAGMVTEQGSGSESITPESVRAAAVDAATLLVDAVQGTSAVPAYYAQVAAHMIDADARRFAGRYAIALRSGFVRHGILAPAAATALTAEPSATSEPAEPAGATSGSPGPFESEKSAASDPVARAGAATGAPAEPASVQVSGTPYGLPDELTVQAPVRRPRFAVTGAAPGRGALAESDGSEVARAFVEDLFRQGRIDLPAEYRRSLVRSTRVVATHQVTRSDDGLILLRRVFD